jgi:transketolase
MNAAALRAKADEIRRTTFSAITHAGGGHYGGSLSLAEILACLYFEIMNVDPANPDDPDRDRLVLSKGHAGPALYSTLALRGYFPVQELEMLDKPLSKFPKHVDRLKLKGIEASTGPLGQGFSIGCGMALGLKKMRKPGRVYVLLGDGGRGSGQGWEAAMTAAKYGLDNLIAIVDRNGCQIDGVTDDIMPLESLPDKFRAFGWGVREVDGHDVEAVLESVRGARTAGERPQIIIARTVKGRGVSFMEGRYEWHSGSMSEEQIEQAGRELESV